MHFVWVNKHDSLYSGHGDIKDCSVSCLLVCAQPTAPVPVLPALPADRPELCSVWSSCAPALLAEAGRGLARRHVLTKAASCGPGREGLEVRNCVPPRDSGL